MPHIPPASDFKLDLEGNAGGILKLHAVPSDTRSSRRIFRIIGNFWKQNKQNLRGRTIISRPQEVPDRHIPRRARSEPILVAPK